VLGVPDLVKRSKAKKADWVGTVVSVKGPYATSIVGIRRSQTVASASDPTMKLTPRPSKIA